jgi:signal transduction histidine kinase
VRKTPGKMPLVSHLGHGRVFFSLFLALLGASMMAVGGAAGGGIALQHQFSRQWMQRSLESQGALAAEMLAPLLREGSVGEARLLLTDIAQRGGLQACRVITADGRIVAESMTDSGPVDFKIPAVTVERPISGEPPATLELTGPIAIPVWMQAQGQFAAGGLLITGLLSLLIAAGLLRRCIRPIFAIGDALSAFAEGEQSGAALAVDARLGARAEAWNRLLEERDRLRHQQLSERARDSFLGREEGRGDLGQACDALWQGMVLIDENLRIKYANGAAAVFLRGKKESLVSGAVADFIADDAVLEAVRSVAKGEVRRRTSHEIHRSDEQGGGILRFSIRPVRRDDAAAALVIIEDITQQRIADDARNAFVAQVTHELRAPLTNIRLYVEQAIEGGEEDPGCIAQSLNIINQESRRLERIVGDMLSVAEIEAGSFKLRSGDVRLESLFEEIEADYRPQAESRNITLALHLPPKLPAIQGDRDKIVLALHNLVGNAIKYTAEGGRVDIRVDVEDVRLIVEVQDNGIGINPEESELIFEKFYRARDKRVGGITGTGLGLALAREVVRLHGGDISVRSQINQGSTFTLTLPTLAKAA